MGIPVIVVAPTGKVLSTSAYAERGLSKRDSRLRRAQSLAMDNGTGLEVCRYLVSVKLAETTDVARRDLMRSEVADAIAVGAERANDADTPFQCKSIEAEYAKKYFRSWSDVRVNFGSDAGLVPEHWDRFGSRLSIVSTYQTARQASNPLNAMLNYLYTVAAAECRLACHAMGVDPGWDSSTRTRRTERRCRTICKKRCGQLWTAGS
jgi:CRISPR/Cas system-associated endonuclease Cas1